jgi:DNA mismatch repair protein MutS
MEYARIERLKEANADALLFVRIGDFYEVFGEDALSVSKELDLTLTGRNMQDMPERVPMAGVPYHAFDRYVERLVQKGYKVAVAESMEIPEAVKSPAETESGFKFNGKAYPLTEAGMMVLTDDFCGMLAKKLVSDNVIRHSDGIERTIASRIGGMVKGTIADVRSGRIQDGQQYAASSRFAKAAVGNLRNAFYDLEDEVYFRKATLFVTKETNILFNALDEAVKNPAVTMAAKEPTAPQAERAATERIKEAFVLRDKIEYNDRRYATDDWGFENLTGDFSRMLTVLIIDNGLLAGARGNERKIVQVIADKASKIVEDMRHADAFLYGDGGGYNRYAAAAQFAEETLTLLRAEYNGLDVPAHNAEAKKSFTDAANKLLNVIDGAIVRPFERPAAQSAATQPTNKPKEYDKMDNRQSDPLYDDYVEDAAPPLSAEGADPQGRPKTEDYARQADAAFARAMREGRYAEIVDAIADLDYSVRNVMLIKSQFPSATKVKAMRFWNYRKRSILPQSKAIKIIAPRFDGGNEGEGNKASGYKINPVFDISQTHGAALYDTRCDKAFLDTHYEGVKNTIAATAGEYAFAEGAKSTSVDYENKEIGIKEGLSREDVLKAMIYCAARVRIEGKERESGAEFSQGRAMFNEIKETAVAHIAARRLGLGDFKLRVIDFSGFDDDALVNIAGDLNRVKSIAGAIAGRVETYIADVKAEARLQAEDEDDTDSDDDDSHFGAAAREASAYAKAVAM